jgi:predicted aspartyl protease
MKLTSSLFAVLFVVCGVAAAQPAAPAAKLTCSVEHFTPNDADKAFQARKFDDAERLYKAMLAGDAAAGPESLTAMAGLVRSELAEGRLADALTQASEYNREHPNNALLLDVLGEVRYRRGEIAEAADLYSRSLKLDPCSARTHYDVSRFQNLSGMHASAQRQLDTAHGLSPDNPLYERPWRASHAVPLTAEQRLANLKQRLENPTLTPEQKDGLTAAIKGIETREKGSCELVTPLTHVTLDMVPIARGAGIEPSQMYAAGLDVEFNGHRKRLEIDTGASGLLLDRSVAKAAGLVAELETKARGIGDEGSANTFVTHVDDIKIGGMEFKNCMVRVLEGHSPLQVDGLIGTDVFRDYVVTLDTPGRQVRLSPLPPRPDEKAGQAASLGTEGDEETPLSAADRAKDRYVAPEMKDWTPIFRNGHDLIVPTSIGDAPLKLFILDTGAAQMLISPDAAREVTHVFGGSMRQIRGISGEVNKVYEADDVQIAFAGVRQLSRGMSSIDTSHMSGSSGVEISGFLGFPMLRELAISIDYRDNLIKVVYDPKHGFHAR